MSALPYFEPRKVKLAMKIGGSYRMHEIGESHWRKLARELGLDDGETLSRIARLAARVPDAVAEVGRQARRDRLVHPIIERLAGQLEQNAKRCLRLLQAGSAHKR